MKARLLTLRFDPTSGGFNDEVLRDLMTAAEVVELRENYFEFEGQRWMTLLVLYRPDSEPGRRANTPRRGSTRNTRKDATEGLDPIELALYESIRSWRSDRAQIDGVPVYVILKNRQIAEIARVRPMSVVALGEVKDIGSARIARYADEILKVIQASTHPEPSVPESEHDASIAGKNTDVTPQ